MHRTLGRRLCKLPLWKSGRRKRYQALTRTLQYRDEIRRIEESLDGKEISLRTSLIASSSPLDCCIKEYQVYADYLADLALRVKRRDPRMHALLYRGLDGCHRLFEQIIDMQLVAQVMPLEGNRTQQAVASAGSSPSRRQRPERGIQTSPLFKDEQRALASPELYQAKEALVRLKHLKSSDMYSALVELYSSLTSSIKSDIPEASETPETWEPEEYHQELKSNFKEMHRLITTKTSQEARNRLVRSLPTQTEEDYFDPRVRILENQLRDKNIEAARLNNEVNLLRMEKRQEAEVLNRTRERLRELEEKLTKLEMEFRSSKRKEVNLSTNLQELKLSQLHSDERLNELVKGQYRLKALLYKSDGRARKAEKSNLSNERLAEEMKARKEVGERQIEKLAAVNGLYVPAPSQAEQTANSTIAIEEIRQTAESELRVKLKMIEETYVAKERELEAKQNQESEELSQEIARLEAILADIQAARGVTGASPNGESVSRRSSALSHTVSKDGPALASVGRKATGSIAEAEGEGGAQQRARLRQRKGSDVMEDAESRDSRTPGSRVAVRRAAGSESSGPEGGSSRHRGTEEGKAYYDSAASRSVLNGGSPSGRDASSLSPQKGRKLALDREASDRELAQRTLGIKDPLLLKGLDPADLDLLEVIFGVRDLSQVSHEELQSAIADISTFKHLPEKERRIFLRVRDTIRKQRHRPERVALEQVDRRDTEFLKAMFGVQDLAVVEKEFLEEAASDLEYFKELPEEERAVYVRIRDTMRKHMKKHRQEVLSEEPEELEGLTSPIGNARTQDYAGLGFTSTDPEHNPELIFDFAPGHNFYLPGLSREEQLKYEQTLNKIMQGHTPRCGEDCVHLRRAYLYRKKVRGRLFPMKIYNLTYAV